MWARRSEIWRSWRCSACARTRSKVCQGRLGAWWIWTSSTSATIIWSICKLSRDSIRWWPLKCSSPFRPEEIGLCKNLSALDLQHNDLLDIPETIGNLVNLARLGLRYNRLTVIPQSLKNCINMEEFNIEGNSVSELQGILASLTLLNSITLSRNSFASFPSGGKVDLRWRFQLKFNLLLFRTGNISWQYY